MIKEREYCSKVIKTEFSKLLVLAKKDHENLKISTKCWISKKAHEEVEAKVKDHDHTTGKYQGFSHQEY